jgi:release factor glutamine methyltransferase
VLLESHATRAPTSAFPPDPHLVPPIVAIDALSTPSSNATSRIARIDDALLALGRWLQAQDYRFTCPTPASHARVLERAPDREAANLADVFGWNLPFVSGTVPPAVIKWLNEAGALAHMGTRLRSRVRFSTLGPRLFLHSSYPTLDADAVFFGPDTFRFARLIEDVLREPWPHPVRTLADIGCGTGAGAILAAEALDPSTLRRVVLRDVNARALDYAATNVALNLTPHAELSQGEVLADLETRFDLIIANPPYMAGDGLQRAYRDGGGLGGIEVALRFLSDGLAHLAPGGRLILYTGTPITGGQDPFKAHASAVLDPSGMRYRYREIDPDVFGESLSLPEYAGVDRIAVVGLVVSRDGGLR